MEERSRVENAPTIEHLYRDHAPAVYAYCVSICRDRVWAEDLMQDTFARATRAIGGYRGGSPRSWLFAIARTTFLDDLRRRRPEPSAEAFDTPVEDPDLTEVDIIERTLARLPERQRTALLLSDRAGLSPAEIGAAMGTTPGAAKVLVHRARVAFRKSYEESQE